MAASLSPTLTLHARAPFTRVGPGRAPVRQSSRYDWLAPPERWQAAVPCQEERMSVDPADRTVRPSTIPPTDPTPSGDTESDRDFEVTLAAMCSRRAACRRLRHYRGSGGCFATCDIPVLLRVAFPAEADLPQLGRRRVDLTRGVELLWRAAAPLPTAQGRGSPPSGRSLPSWGRRGSSTSRSRRQPASGSGRTGHGGCAPWVISGRPRIDATRGSTGGSVRRRDSCMSLQSRTGVGARTTPNSNYPGRPRSTARGPAKHNAGRRQ